VALKEPLPILLEVWPITRFIHHIRNPRKNHHAVDRMGASIKEFGFRVPVLARSSGEVIDGHLRLKAAEKLGMTEDNGDRPALWRQLRPELARRNGRWRQVRARQNAERRPGGLVTQADSQADSLRPIFQCA
jgi:ParB-like chromosome segregation protein Spo0J